ncbi:MAG TPA: SOS response-associated peptidase [Verrucomicrobiae bacterium]|nr:SOS response-associated peptidase [Verrucomicrobiae bacterium]
MRRPLCRLCRWFAGLFSSITLCSMCGRYRLTAKERYLRDHFGLDDDPEWSPRWNIAPTQPVAIVRQDATQPKRSFAQVRWGLVPYWAKEPSIGFKTINAASETAADKPAFRDAIRRRRCLVPADGFYEWRKISAKEKQPYNFGMTDDSVFAFAGLWERWQDAAGKAVETCAILTTRPNALVAEVHDRMPAILTLENYDLWLDPGITDPARVMECLAPFDTRRMKKYPVGTRVNRPENEGPECAQEVPAAQAAPTLF